MSFKKNNSFNSTMMVSFPPVIVSRKNKQKKNFFCSVSQIHKSPEKTQKNTKMTSSDLTIYDYIAKPSEIAPILQIIFQISLTTGQVPDDWKEANVAPIIKKCDKHKPSNYRPVSFTYMYSIQNYGTY